MISAISIPRTAAHNSSLGIMWPCVRATLALPIRKHMSLFSLSLHTFKNATAAMASLEASVKIYTSLCCDLQTEYLQHILGILTSSRWWTELTQADYLNRKDSLRGLSQSASLEVDSIWRNNIFPCTFTGDANPRGSNKLFIVDKTPLRVNGFWSEDILKVKTSSIVSHDKPRLLWTGKSSFLKSRNR